MDKKRLQQLAGMQLNEEYRTRELDINELSRKYEFVVNDDYGIEVYAAGSGRERLLGAFSNFDELLDTGLGD